MDKRLLWHMTRAIILLPGSVLVLIPAVILWRNGWPHPVPSALNVITGIALVLPGLALMAASISLFMSHGKGTLAPWEPPGKLVISGPYGHVRNPMLSGVIMILFSEAAFMSSRPLAVWACLFFLINAVFFPLKEEKDLEKRFGEDYLDYKRNVPRWIPRLRPWQPGQ